MLTGAVFNLVNGDQHEVRDRLIDIFPGAMFTMITSIKGADNKVSQVNEIEILWNFGFTSDGTSPGGAGIPFPVRVAKCEKCYQTFIHVDMLMKQWIAILDWFMFLSFLRPEIKECQKQSGGSYTYKRRKCYSICLATMICFPSICRPC